MDQNKGANAAAGVVRSRAPGDTIMNEIMLRFRPIAPKLASGSGVFSVAEELRDRFTGSKRRKRRYVRASGRRKDSSRREKKSYSGEDGCRSDKESVKTLRLMPDERASEEERDPVPLDLNRAEIARSRVEAESWVTVLSVTDACMDGSGFGCTDEDRWMNLDGDTCPGFVSEADDHVVWSNAAYRRMVAGGSGEEEAASVTVKVAVGESVLLPVLSPAFACMVRVQYTWQQEMRSGAGKAAVVPCDVWRMNGGGYAWRLDVKAGLSLGWNCIN